ncbi:MAG: hypothetical protein ACRD2W_10920, partial [Acidimicrobiales bacterium]
SRRSSTPPSSASAPRRRPPGPRTGTAGRRAAVSPLSPPAPPEPLPHEAVGFAHNSERQFAKLLDFYSIAWEYEPRTFVLEWDRDGQPQQAFSPDFYLPAYDLFIEITTMNQRLVTKKNRKARRLRELHPDVRIKVFYQRDYLNLLVKYGLEEPSQSMPIDASVEPLPLRFDVDGDEVEGEAADPPGTARRRRKPA